MIPFVKQNKLLTLAVAVFVSGLLYYVLVAGKSGPIGGITTSANDSPSVESQQLLKTLASLRTIKLANDAAIFKDEAYLSLTDFGVVIPLQAAGRRNPFASIASSTPLAVPANAVFLQNTKPAPIPPAGR